METKHNNAKGTGKANESKLATLKTIESESKSLLNKDSIFIQESFIIETINYKQLQSDFKGFENLFSFAYFCASLFEASLGREFLTASFFEAKQLSKFIYENLKPSQKLDFTTITALRDEMRKEAAESKKKYENFRITSFLKEQGEDQKFLEFLKKIENCFESKELQRIEIADFFIKTAKDTFKIFDFIRFKNTNFSEIAIIIQAENNLPLYCSTKYGDSAIFNSDYFELIDCSAQSWTTGEIESLKTRILGLEDNKIEFLEKLAKSQKKIAEKAEKLARAKIESKEIFAAIANSTENSIHLIKIEGQPEPLLSELKNALLTKKNELKAEFEAKFKGAKSKEAKEIYNNFKSIFNAIERNKIEKLIASKLEADLAAKESKEEKPEIKDKKEPEKKEAKKAKQQMKK